MSYESLSHTRWDCKYHIVFVPKGRRKVPERFESFWARSSENWRGKGRAISWKGHGGRSCAYVDPGPAKVFGGSGDRLPQGEKRDCRGTPIRGQEAQLQRQLWARGYAVSTVGFEEKQIRKYIRHQDHLDGKDDGLF